MKYAHVIVNGEEIVYALNKDHMEALFLEGMARGWKSPIIISFDEPMTKEEIDRKLND